MKKVLSSLPFILFLLYANNALADLITPLTSSVLFENISLYAAFLINFIINLVLILFFCHFYLNRKDIRLISLLGGTFLVTLFGLIIDFLSIYTVSYISSYMMRWGSPLFILVSLILLAIMYFLIFLKFFKIENWRRIIIASIVLGILTNPAWFTSFPHSAGPFLLE
jgi:hypothetical protein